MQEKLHVEAYYPDEVIGSERFTLILEVKNLSDEEIIITDIRESLVPGKVTYLDNSFTYLDFENLLFYKKSLYDEMWRQVIDANRFLKMKKHPIQYSGMKTLKFLSQVSLLPFGSLHRLLDNNEYYREFFPEDYYYNSFYLTNKMQIEDLKSTYIQHLDENNEIKKAFLRNEKELDRVETEISKLENNNKRHKGKIIKPNQYIKIPIEILCNYSWKYIKKSLLIKIIYSNKVEDFNNVSKEINLNIKPSKKTVLWGAILGVFIAMILTDNIRVTQMTNDINLFNMYFSTRIITDSMLTLGLALLTYDNSHKTPIKAEGLLGGVLIGIISVIGKDKLLEVFSSMINS